MLQDPDYRITRRRFLCKNKSLFVLCPVRWRAAWKLLTLIASGGSLTSNGERKQTPRHEPIYLLRYAGELVEVQNGEPRK